jgi:hypothetical protein
MTMIVTIVLCTGVVLGIAVALFRRVNERLDAVTQSLIRIEYVLGGREWLALVGERLSAAHLEKLRHAGLVERLDRIEAAVDPMTRARLDVSRELGELDEELRKDPSNAYAHWQVTKIEQMLERGERPTPALWEQWIHTPFPWPQARQEDERLGEDRA